MLPLNILRNNLSQKYWRIIQYPSLNITLFNYDFSVKFNFKHSFRKLCYVAFLAISRLCCDNSELDCNIAKSISRVFLEHFFVTKTKTMFIHICVILQIYLHAHIYIIHIDLHTYQISVMKGRRLKKE